MAVEFVRIGPALEAQLTEFLELLEADGISTWFHPHAFDRETAASIAHYAGRDKYFGLMEEGRMIAYGMLRGWDEGYDIPSLGAVVHPQLRGRGLGMILMRHLHQAAAASGAKKTRLSVYPENEAAVRLFRRLRYKFTAGEGKRMVGFKDLP